MKRIGIIERFTALVLAAILSLNGCSKQVSAPSTNGSFSSATSSTTSAVATTTAPPVVMPDPVTGTYNGQTITMKYSAITDYIWPDDNLRPFYFVNGYAPIFYYGSVPNQENLVGGTYIDKTGRMICEPIYNFVSMFNTNGLAVVQKADDSWVYLDTTGAEKGACDYSDSYIWSDYPTDSDGFVDGLKVVEQGEDTQKFVVINKEEKVVATMPGGVKRAFITTKGAIVCTFGDENDGPYGKYTQLYNTAGMRLNETEFYRIGRFYNGLAPFLLDGKLGIIDDTGTIVIPATYPVDTSDCDTFGMNDNLILVNIEGRIGIIEITRS